MKPDRLLSGQPGKGRKMNRWTGFGSVAAAVILIRPLLPYALAFAAGAMIFVVVEQLIPESQQEKHSDVDTAGAMLGFAVMMVLDVALG